MRKDSNTTGTIWLRRKHAGQARYNSSLRTAADMPDMAVIFPRISNHRSGGSADRRIFPNEIT